MDMILQYILLGITALLMAFFVWRMIFQYLVFRKLRTKYNDYCNSAKISEIKRFTNREGVNEYRICVEYPRIEGDKTTIVKADTDAVYYTLPKVEIGEQIGIFTNEDGTMGLTEEQLSSHAKITLLFSAGVAVTAISMFSLILRIYN